MRIHTHTPTFTHTQAHEQEAFLVSSTSARRNEQATSCRPETPIQSASASMRWPPIKTKCARWVPVVELRLRDISPPYIYICIHMYIYTYIYICLLIHMHICKCICICICIRLYIYICGHVYVQFVCIYRYTCICKYVYVHMHVYRYIRN